MKLPDISAMKVGTRNVSAVYLGRTKVWPAYAYSYEVDVAYVRYSSGTAILASGANYAYLEGTVKVWDGATLVETLYNQRLTPEFVGGAGNFYISGNTIRSINLGDDETPLNAAYVAGSYGGSVAVEAQSPVYQDANEIESTSYGAWSYGEWEWLRDETIYRGHTASISASSHTTQSDPVPFAGGIFLNLLTYSASHEEATESFYERDKSRVVTYTWTSGTQSYGTETDTEGKTETTSWHSVSDTPILTKSAEWVTINGRGVTFERNTGDARSVVITAQHPLAPTTVYDTVTLYQARITVPRLIVDFSNPLAVLMSSSQITVSARREDLGYTGELDFQSELRFDGGSPFVQSGTVGELGAVALGGTWANIGIVPVSGRAFTLTVTTSTKYPNDSWDSASSWSGSHTYNYP